MSRLAELRPRTKQRVFDLAESAGLDTTDWIASSNDPRGPKANPKYCFEWSYIQPGKLVILNLWHQRMTEYGPDIYLRENFRADAEYHINISRKPEWARRAQQIDNAIQIALRGNLPVRVILLDGDMRTKADLTPSVVRYRSLDPELWTITEYSWKTGNFVLARGILTGPFIDQFAIDQAGKASPPRREVGGSVFARDPAVRRRVLYNARGACELCRQPGFRMGNGGLYLETHHVVPLSEEGADADHNVVALCAHDHRRAHFGEDMEAIRTVLLKVSAERRYPLPECFPDL